MYRYASSLTYFVLCFQYCAFSLYKQFHQRKAKLLGLSKLKNMILCNLCNQIQTLCVVLAAVRMD